MRRAEWVDLDMRDENGLPMHAEKKYLLGPSWQGDEKRIETLRLQELEGGRLLISITTHTGEVIDYIYRGTYLVRWAKEADDAEG